MTRFRVLAFVALLLSFPAHAVSLSLIGEGDGVWVHPGALGGEVAASALIKPLDEHELLVGAKIGALAAWGENSTTRFDFNWGFSETLWVANAVGGGFDLQVVAPSTVTGEDSSVHYRIVPNVAVRLLHFGDEGAWGVRIGIPYDTHYKWGAQIGVTLQFNGVPKRTAD